MLCGGCQLATRNDMRVSGSRQLCVAVLVASCGGFICLNAIHETPLKKYEWFGSASRSEVGVFWKFMAAICHRIIEVIS